MAKKTKKVDKIEAVEPDKRQLTNIQAARLAEASGSSMEEIAGKPIAEVDERHCQVVGAVSSR
jgi:hypothetical protein